MTALALPETEPSWLEAWPIAYPHVQKSWTVRSQDGTQWATLTPETNEIEPVDPAADRKLPGLAAALENGSLVGYRAERRAVVRSHRGSSSDEDPNSEPSFVKVVRPSRVDNVVLAHRRLSDADLPVTTPRVIQRRDDGRIELQTLPGRSVHDLFREPRYRPLSIPVEQIAETLARVHGIAPASDPQPEDLPERWVAMVGRAEASAVEPLQAVAEQLPALPAGRLAVIHGDLHDKNILVCGHSIALIDLDGVRTGIAEDELANLGVHLQLRCLQSGRPTTIGRSLSARLYRHYGDMRTVSETRIDAAERHTWFRLACLYRFRAASRPLVPALLRLAAGP